MAEPVDQRLPEHTEPEAQAAQQTDWLVFAACFYTRSRSF